MCGTRPALRVVDTVTTQSSDDAFHCITITVFYDEPDDPGLRDVNAMTPEAARDAFRTCCGAARWVQAMSDARPYASADALFARADEAWSACGEDDWLEAFRAHPRIGERKAHADTGAQAARWSSQEQAAVTASGDDVRAALAEVNRAYEERFGFIYIVCASGRSPDELLSLARARLANTRDEELRNAAAEQHKILRLRLEKLLTP